MNTTTYANPWFTAAIGLLGIIIGYALGGGLAPQFGNVQAALIEPPAKIALKPTPSQAPPPTPTPPPPPPSGNPPSEDDDAFLGDENAPVTLIEFTDYQCPFCGRFYSQTLAQIKSDYVDTGKVKIVMRDYPLGFHNNAQKASEATECAEEQQKFWEMHDKIFDNQSLIDVPSLKKYAGDLGLDQAAFDDCLDSGTYAQEVQDDMKDGQASGITGTPGFWIVGPDGKGEKLSGAQPFASFQAAFDRYLQ